ncbi:uncharacterized protein [Linepithema humile]|uniref:uncharacterized protein isoform X2 n=1 Tax=Linepithema humile TaxID=83485 RepID=UPI00351E6FC2
MNRQRQKTLMFGMALLLSNVYAACVLLRNKKKNKRKPRRYAVRPLNRKRHETGHFFSLMKDMLNIEYDQEQFFKYTRCSPSQFNELLQLVGPKLQKDIRRNPFTLSPAHRLTLTLHYLVEGCSMQEIARNFRIGKTTAHVIIKETCQILWNVLQPSVLKRPEADDWKNIAQEFYRRWNMPNCIGAIDVQRWRILRKEIISSVETCEEIVMAAIVLHNFLQKRAEDDIPEHERRYVETGVREYINENGVFQSDLCNKIPCDLRSVGRLGSNNPSRTVKEARDKLADYLISVEGSVPWQWEYVRQGNVP